MKKITILFVIFCLSFTILNAQDKKELKENTGKKRPKKVGKLEKKKIKTELEILEEKFQKATGDSEMSYWLQQIQKYHEKVLKKLEKQHLKEIGENNCEHFPKKYRKGLFLKAAKHWRIFREQQALYEQARFGSGSMGSSAGASARIRITLKRINNLKKLLKNEYYR